MTGLIIIFGVTMYLMGYLSGMGHCEVFGKKKV